jgi:hypothetical protein
MSGRTKDGHREEETLRGTVKALNFAPKGEFDGLLLDVEGETVQVNISPDRAGGIADMVGRVIGVTVGPEPKVADHPKGEHRVHKLIAFDGEHDQGAAGHVHKPRPLHHGDDKPAELTGKVERLNYAKHGESNGVILDGGEFIHLKPDGMKKTGLKVGQQVTVRGKRKPSQSGSWAVEAEIVNGAGLGPKKPH